VHGCLIEPGDVDALAVSINKILSEESWALEVSRRDRILGRTFLQSEVHPRLFSMYDQLLDR
jgi:hypothetical protein